MTTARAVGAVSREAQNGTPWTGKPSTPTFAAPSAYRAGDEGKQMGQVRALQHLLTHSYSGKISCVRRVTENNGKTLLAGGNFRRERASHVDSM